MRPRVVAFHLPQFHPIPENDQWWGKGFTEWTNVVKARPRFPWHYQPHLPADLGFYDLRLPEARIAQADLAREYGIGGFCYYHYWFNGQRLLERPVNEILSSGSPDFPFCLCWANGSWTRTWVGTDRDVLIEQEYSPADDRAHVKWLAKVWEDDRYIRVGGRPLFLIYWASNLPEPEKTVDRLRTEARNAGVGELFLCHVEAQPTEYGQMRRWGFDASVEFQPDWGRLGEPVGRDCLTKLARRLPGFDTPYFYDKVYDYAEVVQRMLHKPEPEYLRFPCVTPMWDNSARRKTMATILRGSTPELYELWLKKRLRSIAERPADNQIVFINAWNEWAEGSHLEPCQRWGRQYLEATRRALQG